MNAKGKLPGVNTAEVVHTPSAIIVLRGRTNLRDDRSKKIYRLIGQTLDKEGKNIIHYPSYCLRDQVLRKMSKLEEMVRVRQRNGGFYPRLIHGSVALTTMKCALTRGPERRKRHG